MQRRTRRLCFGAALALVLSTRFSIGAALSSIGRSTDESSREFAYRGRDEEDGPTMVDKLAAAAGQTVPEKRRKIQALSMEEDDQKSDGEVSETKIIHANKIPFKQTEENWSDTGITLRVLGEPKSGTTWLARVVVELCLQLCGNPENLWCKMGGVRVTDVPPAPRYEFEMLHANTDDLFIHFQGQTKHKIPGLGGDCDSGQSVVHKNGFGLQYPCEGEQDLTRVELMACLPDPPQKCHWDFPPLDRARRRLAVIFRDARNLIISEHRMRTDVYHQTTMELEPYVRMRFKTVVAWIHQRYIWHTTALEKISHVVFYEDLEAHPHHLVRLAAFLGLDSTPEEADYVWQRHTYDNPPGDYTTYGLSTDTLEWMNITMSEVLPEPVLARYGLPPI